MFTMEPLNIKYLQNYNWSPRRNLQRVDHLSIMDNMAGLQVPLSIYLDMSVLPTKAAMVDAVFPKLFLVPLLAPPRRSISTISRLPARESVCVYVCEGGITQCPYTPPEGTQVSSLPASAANIRAVYCKPNQKNINEHHYYYIWGGGGGLLLYIYGGEGVQHL